MATHEETQDRYEPPTVEERTPIGKPLIGLSVTKEINLRVIARPRVR